MLLKNLLKKILTPAINYFNRNMLATINEIIQNRKQLNVLKKDVNSLTMQLKVVHKELSMCTEKNDKIRCNLSKLDELIWAEVFNNTITDNFWLRNKSFSPGRWAIGYPCLYAMFRILNDTRPISILELGLGQSTKMIGQYASYFPNIKHIIIEHDKDWIKFFLNKFKLSKNSKIKCLTREMISYKEAEKVRVFKDFKITLEKSKFDFIFIDAPLGSDMKLYSRIDILSILPNCLMDNFVIMIDDFNRQGEQHTVVELEKILTKANIKFYKGIYSGQKSCVVISSSSLKFVTTL